MSSTDLRNAFHYLYEAELPFLKELANMLPDNPVVVNIGAGAGTSGLAFMEARRDLTLVTIDITAESSPFGCLEAEEVELKKSGFWEQDRNFQLHEDSKKAGMEWEEYSEHLDLDIPLDMVFVDGDHSYLGCRGDILAWLPHIKPGGIIAIHDYKKAELPVDYANSPHPKPWPGVDQAVDEYLLDKYMLVRRVDSLIAFYNVQIKTFKVGGKNGTRTQ